MQESLQFRLNCLRHVGFGRLHHHLFPSGVQRIAGLVMELSSFRSTWPTPIQYLLVANVRMSSWQEYGSSFWC